MRELLVLLRVLGSPFARQYAVRSMCFSKGLYELALRNKVVFRYLSSCVGDCAEVDRLYRYHRSRLGALMSVLYRICQVLGEEGFDYVVFKTLRPFEEDVADIDVLYLSRSVDGYYGLVESLERAGFRVMEVSFYCVTFEDPSYRFVTEVMVDVYREVSVGPLVYLDKGLFADRVEVKTCGECRVRVLDIVSELLVTVAHSIIKEREIKLLDYLTALYLLHAMSYRELEEYVAMAHEGKLVYASRLFLSAVAGLHRLAHGFIPEKLSGLLDMLGGAIDVSEMLRGVPPYRIRWEHFARIMREKMEDPVFRSSLVKGLGLFLSRRSWARLVREVF